MPHVLIAGKLHPAGIALIKSSNVSYDYVEEVSEAAYVALLPKADALVIRTQPLTATTIATAPNLRIVSRHGVGYDAVDVPALNARKIPLTIVGDVNSVAVAEQAMMLLLAAAKRCFVADRSVRSGDWNWRNKLAATELSGKNLLIIGYGRIGRRLAALAAPFGMTVKAHDPWLDKAGWPAGAATSAPDLDAAFGWADAISINAPKTEKPLVDTASIARMRRGVIIVNTARGSIIDEPALTAALRDGRVGAAGLDVFEAEPPAKDNPLFALDNVVLSPHIAGLSVESAERMAISCVENVLAFFAGKLDPALIVNRESLK